MVIIRQNDVASRLSQLRSGDQRSGVCRQVVHPSERVLNELASDRRSEVADHLAVVLDAKALKHHEIDVVGNESDRPIPHRDMDAPGMK